MSTIPASTLVSIVPNVLSAGGNALVLNGLVLTTNVRVPIGQVLSFPSALSVSTYFGASAEETAIASVYFGGFDHSTQKPASILFAQYPETAVAAYLRGGPVDQLTLAQLQSLSGSLNVLVDGYSHDIPSISLAAFNSFSAAAAGIGAAFTDPTESTFTASIGAAFTGTGSGTDLTITAVTGLISPGDLVTGTGVPAATTIVSQTSGTPGGAGVYVTSQATTATAASLTSSSTVMDVTVVATGQVAAGQTVSGAGITGTPVITAQVAGTAGGIGTYRISGAAQDVASESITGIATAPVVTYDSVAGAFVITSGITGQPSTAAFATGTLAASLFLTSATGAVLSQGAAAAVPGTFMTALAEGTQDWATFMTAFDPDGGSGNSVKLAFAEWTDAQNKRFAYIVWDTDITPTESANATASLGNIIAATGLNGTCCVYEPNDQNIAAFVCGTAASIDFDATNGRITFAFKGQAGLVAGVTSQVVAANLIANGYNFYGAYATASQQFLEFQPGSVSGEFEWLDSFVNQIWLNSQLQLALMVLLQQSNSIPYAQAGYELIKAACQDPINAALNCGVIRAGVTLSDSQAAQVNAAAGIKVNDVLQSQGWYLQVQAAAPLTRQARKSPPINFWYVDGESIQQITLNSILVQ